jgi:hypothetical protein
MAGGETKTPIDGSGNHVRENTMFNDDRPITAHDQDRFGYDGIASNLSLAISGLPQGAGLTIGVEGKWGTGKTSLTNLLVEHLRAGDDRKVRVFKFSPWLFPSSKSYAVEFLTALASEIDKAPDTLTVQEVAFGSIAEDLRGRKKSRTIALGDRVRGYAAHFLGLTASALKFGEKANPKLLPLRIFAGAAAKGLHSFKIKESADSQKAGIITELNRLAYKYVVIIDDLDRLEPAEALEVMRLIRSIADFPNVVYVLCYDRDTLAHAVEEGLSIPNGNAYLEKIVQLTFSLPRAEAFDLRDWALVELAEVYRNAVGTHFDGNVRKRLLQVLDFYALQLSSPRQVRRLVNAAAFHFRPVNENVDFADICWLHGAKLFAPKLYNWAARYLPEMAVILSAGFHATDTERKLFSDDLKSAMNEFGDDSPRSLLQLSRYLPGIGPSLKEGEPIRVFGDVRKEVLTTLESGRRLGSPAHFRYYFAFSSPRDAMSESELNGLIELLKGDVDRIGAEFLELASRKRPVGGDWLNYFFDRLTRIGLGDLLDEQLVNLSVAIARVIDIASGKQVYRGAFAPPSAYDLATDLVLEALRELKKRERSLFEACLLAVANERSIGWLLEDLLHTELRHHGLAGKGAIEDPYLAVDDLNMLKEIISDRLDTVEAQRELNNATDMVSLLYRWRELDGDDPARPHAWLNGVQVTDDGFIDILLNLRSWRATSEQVDYLLREEAIGDFLDWDAMVIRVQAIADNVVDNPDLASRAEEVLQSIRLAKDAW